MTETMQRMPQSKPPVKRVHFEELRPTRYQSHRGQKIKAVARSSSSSFSYSGRELILPSKSAMKTITPTVFANSMNLKNAKEQEPIVPNIFSAPPETHSPKQKSEERVGKKNSSTQVKEEEIQPPENNGITPELIKKVASLKPIIDNAASNAANDELKGRKNEKVTVSKKTSTEKEARTSKTSSNGKISPPSTKSKKDANGEVLVTENDSATAQVVLGPMRSRDPVHNALNFSAIQQQQKEIPAPVMPPSALKKTPSKKY